MKKHTVDVLDAADALERKMRWLDFKNEQENRNRYIEGVPNVGDLEFAAFIKNDWGYSLFSSLASVRHVEEFHRYIEDRTYDETFPNIHNLMFCDDCEVFTNIPDLECWWCGRNFEEYLRQGMLKGSVACHYEIDFDNYHFELAFDGWSWCFTVDSDQFKSSVLWLDMAKEADLQREKRLAEMHKFYTTFSDSMTEAARQMTPVMRRFSDGIAHHVAVAGSSMRELAMTIDEWVTFDTAQFDVETTGLLWYQQNPIDVRVVIDDHFSPAPILDLRPQYRPFRLGGIMWPENVSMEPSVPLPGPVYETPDYQEIQARMVGYPVDQWVDQRSRRRR